jgi:hypothetical protein
LLEVFGDNPRGELVRGRFRKTFGVRADPDTRAGFPLFLGASGESSGKLTDLDGDGAQEYVTATSDGLLHAIQADASERDGFPVRVGALPGLDAGSCSIDGRGPKCHRRAAPFVEGLINPDDVRQSVMGAVAIGDLSGDGSPGRDVVVATLDGGIYAFDAYGQGIAGFPVGVAEDHLADGLQRARVCERDGVFVVGCRDGRSLGERGVFAAPVLVDLNGDGSLEIVVAALDSWMYAWHADGTEVNGWPVHLVHPTQPGYLPTGELNRSEDRIVGSPAVADLFGDGTPIVAVGTTERLENAATSFLYAVWPDANAHDGGPFPAGWPANLDGFIAAEILPFVGKGNPNSPAAGDMDGDGDDEFVAAGLGGLLRILQADGSGDFAMESTVSAYGDNATTDELASLPMINNPTVADMDGDGQLDIVNGTVGTGLISLATAGGRRAKFDHTLSAWRGQNGYFHDGFPQVVNDYQFFMNYAVGDIDGDGQWNSVSGDGGYFVHAFNTDGSQAAGFPKYTQGWHITTPALGDIDGDERIDVVAQNREGWLWMWESLGHVGGPASQTLPAIQWAGFHHDDQNTGNASEKFATLTKYPRQQEPDDGGGCSCQQRSSSPLAGVLAVVMISGMMLRRRTSSAFTTKTREAR